MPNDSFFEKRGFVLLEKNGRKKWFSAFTAKGAIETYGWKRASAKVAPPVEVIEPAKPEKRKDKPQPAKIHDVWGYEEKGEEGAKE